MKGMVRSDARKRIEQDQRPQRLPFVCYLCASVFDRPEDLGMHFLLCSIYHAEQAEEKR